MTYTINTFDGNFLTNVAPGTVDTNTSLSLLGKNYSGYGQIIASNFVFLTENFAKTMPPTNSLKGQLWYDKSENILKVCSITGDPNSFERLQVTVGASAAEPGAGRDGDLFYDTDTKHLKVRDGSAFVNASIPGGNGAELMFVKLTSRATVGTTIDGAIKNVAVMVIRDPATPTATLVAGNIASVFSQEEFYFSPTEPAGQGKQSLVDAVFLALAGVISPLSNGEVNQGMNINTGFTSSSVPYAADADLLDGNNSTYYLDYLNFTNSANAPFVATNADTTPNADNTHTVGTSIMRFANIYSTTFTGALAGNASTASDATNFGGQLPAYYTNADNLSTGTVPTGRLTGTYAIDISGTAAVASTANALGGFSASNWVDISSNQTIAGVKTFTNNVIMNGDLTINGTTTTVDTTNMAVSDALVQLASGNTGSGAAYIGIQAERGSAGNDGYFVWEESSDRWRATTSAAGTTHADADIQCGTLYGNVSGSVTGNMTAITTGSPTTPGTIEGAWTLVSGSSLEATYADIAERFHADETMEAGTVVELGGVNEITATSTFCSTNVFGVVSTDPAYRMNSDAGTSNTHPYVALHGRVPVCVIGKVNKGDRLISSEIPGVAQALPKDFIKHCTDTNDHSTFILGVIGRALDNKDNDEVGIVEAFVLAKS